MTTKVAGPIRDRLLERAVFLFFHNEKNWHSDQDSDQNLQSDRGQSLDKGGGSRKYKEYEL